MFIEKRKAGKDTKYYLVHSYRENGNVKKLRKYLGLNLSPVSLQKAREESEKQINRELKRLSTEVFAFSLTKSQLNKLNKYEEKIKIRHLQGWRWKIFTEKFTYNTNAIEGSTIQLSEVPEILRRKKAKNAEELETKGVAKAVAFIRTTKEDLSLNLIKKLHSLCFEGSKHFAGKFRNVEVVIRTGAGEIVHAGVPAAQLNEYLDDLISWYRENKDKFKPLILATIIHNQFEFIHPFQDGNGRVGRLLLNFILLKKGYPPININFVDRRKYYEALQEYSQHNDLKHTIKFLVEQYKKTLEQVTTKLLIRKNVGP